MKSCPMCNTSPNLVTLHPPLIDFFRENCICVMNITHSLTHIGTHTRSPSLSHTHTFSLSPSSIVSVRYEVQRGETIPYYQSDKSRREETWITLFLQLTSSSVFRSLPFPTLRTGKYSNLRFKLLLLYRYWVQSEC